jgi:hypothetical protein
MGESLVFSLHLISTLPSGTVHAVFNQKAGAISARMKGNMSLVTDGGFIISAFKSHIIASQCQPFGKLQDSKICSF